MDFIDLHVHSSCSDGTLSPAQVTSLAAQKGLRAIALTDHDTVSGISEALEAGKKLGVEIIPGIEFSTSCQNRDVHIVGLHINPCDAYFLEALKEFQSSRNRRNEKIIGLLQQAGISVSWKAMADAFPDCVWTRAHFARYLMEHGYVSSVREAFPRYLGDHAPCFVPREKVTPWQAIELIHQSGGIAVLAHPLLYGLGQEQLRLLFSRLRKAGLDGVEVFYSSNSREEERLSRQLARDYDLVPSGGSDFHGDNKPEISLGTGRGNLRIPYSVLEQLRERRPIFSA